MHENTVHCELRGVSGGFAGVVYEREWKFDDKKKA